MKKFILFARVGLISILVLLQPAVRASHFFPSPAYLNYVVIGAFAIEKNAEKFTSQAIAAKHAAKFDINPSRNLYYVYVLSTDDHQQAIAEALRLRKETQYADAWVYQGAIGTDRVSENTSRDINPVSQEPIEHVAAEENKVEPVVTETKDEMVNAEVKPAFTEESLSKEEILTRNFVFNLYRGTDGKPVEGEVDEIDTEKSRKMASYKGNTPVKVTVPTSKSGNASFIAQAFGYRKLQTEFSFKSADEKNLTVDGDGNIVIPFELVRLQKGDISVMYNVFFFVDAAVMRPESKFEVNSLLQMMQENPDYRIKIHGHTNGNSHGKIITMGESQNFFSLTGTNEGFGSAKKLSEERASAIKQYLVANGIEESRMLIKAWGGKKPIHDRHANRANENVRVEVEILE